MTLQNNPKSALSIAGSDPSGGAGIQCDLKTFMAHEVYGMAVPTMLTIQNTKSIQYIECFAPKLIQDQLKHLIEDLPPTAIKIGAIGNLEQARVIQHALTDLNIQIVWDPVLISSSGTPFLPLKDIPKVIELFLPMICLATPNHIEAEYFQNISCNLLVTNGEADSKETITDVLYLNSGQQHHFTHPRFETPNTHGTGCTLSSAITANLAKGHSIETSCIEGIRYCSHLLKHSSKYNLGHGKGALGHEFSSRSFPR